MWKSFFQCNNFSCNLIAYKTDVLLYEHTVETYNVITVNKVILAQCISQTI